MYSEQSLYTIEHAVEVACALSSVNQCTIHNGTLKIVFFLIKYEFDIHVYTFQNCLNVDYLLTKVPLSISTAGEQCRNVQK